MTFVVATIFMMTASVALIYRLTDYFGFHLKLSSLALCAVMAFVVNFTAILLSPYLTEEHYIRLGVLVIIAAAFVTMYNEFLLAREERLARADITAVPLTDAERAMAEDDDESIVIATATVEPVAPITATSRVNPVISEGKKMLEKMRRKALERRDKVRSLQKQSEEMAERARLDELAKQRAAEKQRQDEKLARERQEKEQKEQAAREKAEQEKRERERIEQEEREKSERAERERQARLDRERLEREQLERERQEEERRKEERLERERIENEERERRRKEEQLERERIERERIERERAERERQAQILEKERQERLAKERAEQQKTAAPRTGLPPRPRRTLDELLDDAFAAKEKGDKAGAVTALGSALRLYPDDDYAPFVAVDLANVFKEAGDYKAAVGTLLKAMRLNAVNSSNEMRDEFRANIQFLRRTDEVLMKKGLRGMPFSQIPPAIMREIENDNAQ